MAEPSSKAYQTISDDPEASYLTWDIKTVPNMEVGGFIASHYIFDTTKVDDYIVEAFEALLYGTAKTTGRLPTAADLQKTFVDTWTLTVTDTGLGYYEISGSDQAVKNMQKFYQIAGPTVKDNNTDYSIETG